METPRSESVLDGEVVQPKPVDAAPLPKPKRGRKPKTEQSKNVNLGNLPDEILEPVALAPLILASAITKVATTQKDAQGNIVREGVRLSFDADASKAIIPAFKAWLATLDIELSPGYALIGCYLVAISSALPEAIGEYAAQKTEVRNVAKKPEQPSGDDSGSVANNPPPAA